MKNVWLSLVAMALVVSSGCQAPPETSVSNSNSASPLAVRRTLDCTRLFLPPEIYAVPGVETNIYFANTFLCLNPANYAFDVSCPVGRHDLKRWRYTPKISEAGKSFPLKLQVLNEQGLIAQARTVVKVASPQAGAGKTLTILMIGDSLTDATIYPTQVHKLMQGKNNPRFKMLGSHAGNARNVQKNGVAHEGYGGWTWQRFLSHYQENIPANATRRQRLYARSPFLTKVQGKVKFDFQGYLDKFNGGKAPDVITFQLGVNDIFHATDQSRENRIRQVLANADALIQAVRQVAPRAIIGVGYVTPGANQDAFGRNYKCGQTAWGYRQNVFWLNRAMYRHFAAAETKLYLIPVQLNLDCEHNFPAGREAVNGGNKEKLQRQRNGVHPALPGYRQMGDTYYAWLKYLLSQQ